MNKWALIITETGDQLPEVAVFPNVQVALAEFKNLREAIVKGQIDLAADVISVVSKRGQIKRFVNRKQVDQVIDQVPEPTGEYQAEPTGEADEGIIKRRGRPPKEV